MTTKTSSVRAAREGETFRLQADTFTVGPKCGAEHGRWICITHPNDPGMNSFRTQLQKDIHISQGRHVLAWICSEHGAEVP